MTNLRWAKSRYGIKKACFEPNSACIAKKLINAVYRVNI